MFIAVRVLAARFFAVQRFSQGEDNVPRADIKLSDQVGTHKYGVAKKTNTRRHHCSPKR